MAVIEVSGLAFAHPGGAELFRDVTFRVGSGGHTALVGPNGVGKSTVFGCIAGLLSPSAGTVRTDAPVAVMSQSIGAATGSEAPVESRSQTTVRELLAHYSVPAVRDAALQLERALRANEEHPTERTGIALANAYVRWGEIGGYDVESRWDASCSRVLRQSLDDASGRPISTLSGGERKRLVLESLFSSDVPILLLDEPDNFLDIPSKRWLERTIASSPKTILFVSHDRELLAAASTHIVTLEVNGCWTHPGGWASYEDARRARNDALGDALERWKAEERRLFQYYKLMKQRAAVNDGNASRANAAESRWRRYVAVGPPPPPPPARSISVNLRGRDSGKVALRCEQLAIDGLIEPFDLEVHQGDRVALLGPNGTGKSHLLRLLSGEPIEHGGAVHAGARIESRLFHQTDDVPEFRGRTPLDIMSDHDLAEEQAMRALARYGLADGARREVETLSGGQRARLQVLSLELSGVNLLLLDEPTDNLDLASTEALEHSLDTFQGTVLAVTHDRWFMRGMNRWLILDDDGGMYEALDLSTALHTITGDPSYTSSSASLLVLTA